MQTGALISFTVTGKNNHTEVNRFCRAFYGYNDKSNKGQYTYKREGFIDKYPHIKVQRGLIIINMDDAEEIINMLEKHNAEIFMREIILLHTDKQQLKDALNKKYNKTSIIEH